MIFDIDNDLLIKYLKGELTEEGCQKVIKWLERDKENQDFLFGLKELYLLGQWEELSKKADTDFGWEKLLASIQGQIQFRKKVYTGLKYVAILTVCFFMGYGYKTYFSQLSQTKHTVMTGKGEKATIILDDGTKIILNEKSKLTYPDTFGKNDRKVTLNGGAYFEVSRKSPKTFLVDAGMYTIKVLGTKFAVKAYPEDNYSYTSLKEGKVQILKSNADGGQIISELKSSMQLVYNVKKKQYKLQQIDVDVIDGWIKGRIDLKHKTLTELVNILEYKYGYTFRIHTHSIERIVYNIVLEQESLEEILSNINLITPQVHYSIDHTNRTVTLH